METQAYTELSMSRWLVAGRDRPNGDEQCADLEPLPADQRRFGILSRANSARISAA
jgi:hypothetical protein